MNWKEHYKMYGMYKDGEKISLEAAIAVNGQEEKKKITCFLVKGVL